LAAKAELARQEEEDKHHEPEMQQNVVESVSDIH